MIAGFTRILRLGWIAARHLGAHVLRRRRGPTGPHRLRLLLEDAGGTWLKFGQILALQPDALPRAYCNALFDLMDRVPPFEFAEVERIFVEELGRRPAEIFDEFEAKPFASASIGQVHCATIGGRVMAVKVQRPDVSRSFAADLHLMAATAGFIRRLHLKNLAWLERAIGEFIDWTQEELDYRHEARFMAALFANAGDNPRERVPMIDTDLSTARILVAEMLDGPMVVDYIRATEGGRREAFEEDLKERGFDRRTFAHNIVRNFVSDAFEHGLFHADLHPANLLVLPESVVGYVDFGITGSLSGYSRHHLVALTLALTRADLDAMVLFFLRLAATDERSDVAAFRRGLGDLIESWYDTDRRRPVMRESFTRVMLDMLRLSRESGVWPTPDVIRYIRSVITADGLIARFAPEFNVGDCLEEICEEHLKGQALQQWFSLPNIADWLAAASNLVVPATTAVAAGLRDFGAEPSGEVSRGENAPNIDDTRALWWGLVALAGAASAVFSASDPQLGLNLFTAGVALTTAAATMFVKTIRR